MSNIGPINNCNVVPPNIKIVNEVGIIEDSLWKSEITWSIPGIIMSFAK